MSDSSSVDRWHPSNVEWPKHKDGTPNRTIGPTNPAFLTGYYRPGKGPEVVPLAAYEALYADRGRVLAAVEKRVEGLRLVPPNVGYGDGWQDYNSAIDDALNAIKSSSSSSTEEREV